MRKLRLWVNVNKWIKKKTSCYSNKASKTSLPSPSLLPHCQGPPSRSLQPHHNNALKQRSVRSAPSIATHHPLHHLDDAHFTISVWISTPCVWHFRNLICNPGNLFFPADLSIVYRHTDPSFSKTVVNRLFTLGTKMHPVRYALGTGGNTLRGGQWHNLYTATTKREVHFV